MATLIDSELFEYLDNLSTRLERLSNDADKNSIDYSSHRQFIDIIDAEKNFLKYINSNGTKPALSISPNGLPSVQSLVPDLEKMCEIANENPESEFSKISHGINIGKNRHPIEYSQVSEKEWNKEFEKYKGILNSQAGFSISNGNNEKLELCLNEEFYLKGYDKTCATLPILQRKSRTNYHVVWNNILHDTETEFFSVKKDIIPVNNLPEKRHYFKEGLAPVENIGKKTAKILGFIASSCLISPTLYRMIKKNYGDDMPTNLEIGHFVGAVTTGMASLGYLVVGVSTSNLPLFPLVGVLGTNAASGLYEWYRYEKNKLKKYNNSLHYSDDS